MGGDIFFFFWLMYDDDLLLTESDLALLQHLISLLNSKFKL
jgi:hypothetical protein